jgi:hypothetical protein
MALGVTMVRDRSKVTPFSVRFDPDVKKVVERQAKADMRSGAAWIEKLVIDHLREKGLLKPNEDEEAE